MYFPPISDLNEIAEQFNLDYHLTYQTAYQKENVYRYTCLQNRLLSAIAEDLKIIINEIKNSDDLLKAEAKLHEFLYSKTCDYKELRILTGLLGKKIKAAHLYDPSLLINSTDNKTANNDQDISNPEIGR